MRPGLFHTLLALALVVALTHCKPPALKHTVSITDHKTWKRLLKTRTNVLTLFVSGDSQAGDFLSTFEEAAGIMKGRGTLAFVDCSSKDGKKLCKSLKVKTTSFALKHFKDGAYLKDYDRLLTLKSLLSFMENPASEPPWSEEEGTGDVRHVESPEDFERLVKKESRPILVMFYAPWCGHCKALKPEFAAAATELKGRGILAGMDVDNPDAYGIRQALNITGFPTLVYFERGVQMYRYGGGRDKKAIVEWMQNPAPPVEAATPPEESSWQQEESDVVHATDDTFDSLIAEHASVLVMFYAPWCGHCKAIKPSYMEAATAMKTDGIAGTLAAIDATKETKLAERFEVKGFPTLKYFQGGEFKFDYGSGRTTQDLLDFMVEPTEPPPPEPEWSQTQSEVVHLTDESFKGFLKKKKHVLVMFYAPWCGHCKAAKPEYTTAAEVFNEDKKVSFAAVDCTQHTAVCGQQKVSGYPTIKYFNYGKGDHLYNGPRSEAGFVAFMSDPTGAIRDEL